MEVTTHIRDGITGFRMNLRGFWNQGLIQSLGEGRTSTIGWKKEREKEVLKGLRNSKFLNQKIRRILLTFFKFHMREGYPKKPHLKDLMDIMKDEVRAAADKTFIGTGFGEANRIMQKKLDKKKGDGNKRERMKEESPPEALQKQVETLSKAVESLASK
ncbi:hypothetical protein VP01_3358g2, partial [Puccinia sorghi]